MASDGACLFPGGLCTNTRTTSNSAQRALKDTKRLHGMTTHLSARSRCQLANVMNAFANIRSAYGFHSAKQSATQPAWVALYIEGLSFG